LICISKWIESGKKDCPLCRSPFDSNVNWENIDNNQSLSFLEGELFIFFNVKFIKLVSQTNREYNWTIHISQNSFLSWIIPGLNIRISNNTY